VTFSNAHIELEDNISGSKLRIQFLNHYFKNLIILSIICLQKKKQTIILFIISDSVEVKGWKRVGTSTSN